MKIDEHLTRELKKKAQQQKENKMKMNDKIKLNKILKSYERKGYIIDDSFFVEYEKEINKKMKQK